ncbi:hypothetical protein V1512DRAFT_238690 [Lipomyces arxii]|uniref:uncharacterized protein n=1 Tax=Lipomyces arxii TaxID=56418 RepID=UPI0034CDF76F
MSLTPNFTGNFRHGRHVNLAQGSTTTYRSSQSILKDASAARAQREQTRKRDRAAVRIQSLYRGRTAVARARDDARHEFIRLSNLKSTEYDLSRVVALFVFFFGKGSAQDYSNDANYVPELERMLLGNAYIDVTSAGLKRKLAKVLLSCLTDRDTSSDVHNACLRLLRGVQMKAPLQEVIKSYSSLLSNLGDPHDIAKVIDNVVLELQSCSDEQLAAVTYVKYFLSTPHLFEKLTDPAIQYQVQEVFDFSTHIIPLFEQLQSALMRFENPEEQDIRTLWLLVNILYMWSHPRTLATPHLTINFMRTISYLIDGLSSRCVKQLSRATANECDQSYDKFVLDNLKLLKARHIIEMAIAPVKQFLISSGSIPVATDTANSLFSVCKYFVSLLKIWPSRSGEIRYYLYLTPEYTLPLFFKTLQASRLYTTVSLASSDPSVSNSGAICLTPASDDPYRQIAIQEWELLSLFLDICWHWMIMADDDEFFDESQYGLQLADVIALGTLLKKLVFLIICNEDTSVVINRGRQLIVGKGGDNNVLLSNSGLTLNKVKNDAIGVMRQLFYRDSRRKFLDKSFWLLDDWIELTPFASQAAVDTDKMEQYLERHWRDTDDKDIEMSSASENEELPESASASWREVRLRTVMTPRIEILQKVPFVLPFETRVKILDKLLELDRTKSGLDTEYEFRLKRYHAEIHRDRMLEDAFEHLKSLRGELKSLIGITFVNEFGVEAGIDGGGITKEFLVGVCKDGFKADKGLFLENSENLLYPNPAATSPDQLARFEFLGRIISKAIYQGILVEVSFAQFFLSKWQVQNNKVFGSGFRNTFDDLWSLDPELYKGLIKLKRYVGDVESDFGLNFTVTDGHNRTVELITGGSQIAVTNSNRIQYIHAVANFKLNNELYRQTNAFLSGMNDLLAPAWLAMFSATEMQTLVGGAALPIDVEDWKRNTVYGKFHEKDPTIVYFWEVVDEMNDEEVRSLLKFVTSVSRAPLQGFKTLKPAFTIQEAGSDESRLPTASTCVNMIKLPRYKTKERLKSKLLLSVMAGAGFDLS